MSRASFQPVRGDGDLESALAEPVAVLYKHSPLCGLSAIAAGQVLRDGEAVWHASHRGVTAEALREAVA